MKAGKEKKDFLSDDLFIFWRLHPSEQLDRYWKTYLSQHEDLRKDFLEAIEAFDRIRVSGTADQTTATATKRSLDQRIKMHRQRTRFRIYAPLSAAILLIAVITTLFLIGHQPERHEPSTASIGEVMNNPQVKLLTGEQTLEIGDHSVLDLSEKKNCALVHDSVSHKEITLPSHQTNRLIVPYGKRSSIVLADGSTVYLNSGTEMEFPSVFPAHSREIRVEGEVFLEVKHQKGKPFIIHTPRSQITVYGTSFNVTSYSDDSRESVVLVSGSVKVLNGQNELILKPSERAVVEHGTLISSQVDVDDYISWKSGYLKLSKTPLNEVLTRIGRYYNVAFRYPHELNLEQRSCSGKLFLSDNLEDVLQSFSKLTFLTYEQNENTILIKP